MSSDPTGFLYPFIESEERDVAGLVENLAASATAKMAESSSVGTETLARCSGSLSSAASAMARSFEGGGRLLAFGNGGSATDAAGIVALFTTPPRGRPLRAMSLVDDLAVLTALANDIGFEVVFSRQVIAHGRPGDVAVGFSTSGGSQNVLRAFEEASARGMLTVGLAGYEGGAMAASPAVEHCLVVHSDSVHRIQEAQSRLVWSLWTQVQDCLSERSEP
ncbi:MAG: D-sedoheptulose-7-phosphate isomerase [Acidimicrobiales bacterium]